MDNSASDLQASPFTSAEIAQIRCNFESFDLERKGYVTISDISRGMRLVNQVANPRGQYQQQDNLEEKNPMFRRILCQAANGQQPTDKIEFERFLQILSIARSKQQDAKIRFLFELYCSKKQGQSHGKIDQDGIFQILNLIVGAQLNDEKLMGVIRKTIDDLDTDRDGYLEYEDFRRIF